MGTGLFLLRCAFILPILLIVSCATACADQLARGQTGMRLALLLPEEEIYYAAAAWADAIDKASKILPSSTERRLWERDLDNPLAEKALAALLMPPEDLEVSFDEDNEAGLTLEIPEDLEESTLDLLSAPENLLLAMSAWADLENQLEAMRQAWPEGLGELWRAAPTLQAIAAHVKDLLGFFLMLADEDTEFRTLSDTLAASVGQSAPALSALLASRRDLREARPRAALEKAESALARATELQESLPEAEAASDLLAAIGRLYRGEAHLHLGQNALAALDLAESASLFEKLPVRPAWRATVESLQGELARRQKKWPEMCEHYKRACAFGDCQPLATARKDLQCD